MTFAEWITGLLRFFGGNQERLADAVGVKQPTVSRWVNGTLPMLERLEKLNSLARRHNYPEYSGNLVDLGKIRIAGYAGAGGNVHYDQPMDGEPDTIDAPPGTPPQAVAIEIRGESLGAGFDRWYAIYFDRRDPITEDMLGHLCIVGTGDGRTLVKWVHRGHKGFILKSGTGAIEDDVSIEWAAKVIDLKPRL